MDTLYITIDPFNKTSEIYPFDSTDADMRWLKWVFDEIAEGFEERFQVKVENDVISKSVIATLVGTEETHTIGYAMVGFKVNQVLHAVRYLAEDVGLFQWDITAYAGQVIYRKET